MKKLIRNILSQKKIVIPLALLLLGGLIFANYMLTGIQANIQKIAELQNETPDYFPPYPPVNTAGKDPALIQRGEYLAKTGDCIACHTNTFEKGKPFAGGLPMVTPFGTIYSPNITPDKETGIGHWTTDEFITAMRKGISPKGHYYYPAFPYLYFNKVTTDDLKAIKAYLDAIPAVKQKNRENEMVEPFDERFLQLGWRLLFFHQHDTGSFKENPSQTPEWNRGAYLVEGLGHCAMCHSPSYYLVNTSYSLGAPMRKYNLTGAKIQGYLAPNITKANLDKISDEEIIQVFTEDRMIGGGKVEGPMVEVNHNSLRNLSHADLLAIATYLRSVQSATPPKPKVGKEGPGKPIYDVYCSGCHAAGAGGAPLFGDPTAWTAVTKKGMGSVYDHAIKGIGGMPAKGTCLSCSDVEIKQAVDYMITASKKGRHTSAAKPKKLTLEDGKRVYDTNCSICHNSGFNNAPKLGDKKSWEPFLNKDFLQMYENMMSGEKGHPPHGACAECSDAELIAAMQYILSQSGTTKNYNLW